MIDFITTTIDDLPQILEWISADPYHLQDANPESAVWFLTGANCFLSCAVKDEEGLVLYIQLRKENDWVRIGTQFAPENQVSRKRVAKSIAQAMPVLKTVTEKEGFKGLIFESISPSLIKFMFSFGFQSYEDNDYLWVFGKE